MKDGREVAHFAVQVIRVNSSPMYVVIASVGQSASHFRSTLTTDVASPTRLVRSVPGTDIWLRHGRADRVLHEVRERHGLARTQTSNAALARA
jgi:hypothetical protein